MPKTVDDLKVGDLVKSFGQTWRVTEINGDVSINFKNLDTSSNLADQALIGRWKENFYKQGFEIVEDTEKS